jgi:anaerobic selenocysteine-containing dehydrogenase
VDRRPAGSTCFANRAKRRITLWLPAIGVEDVGAMREVQTVCARDCYDTCALIARLDESGQIEGIRGDPRNPVTRGFTCPRGAKDHQRLYANRVTAPSMRLDDRFEETDWETALNTVSGKLWEALASHGPQSVLYLGYAGNTGLLAGEFAQRLWNAIGATQTDLALCSASGHAGLRLHYGESFGVEPMELLSTKLIVFWGFNAAVSSPHVWSLARKARSTQGAQIVVVDPRESRTARGADLWIQPWPGSDVALTYGLINYLSQRGYLDLEFLEAWTQGFDRLEEQARKWSPARVEQVTGVEWRRVRELGEAYGTTKPSATMIGIGLQKCDQGADQVRAVSFIPALLGLHRGFFYSNAHAFSVDVDRVSGRSLTENTPKIVRQVYLPDLVSRGEFKFIYVSGMNPALTLPNQYAFREGLSRDDVFVVVHDTHWTKTARYADVVLPAPTYLEKEDLVIPWTHHYVGYSSRIVSPVTDSRSEVWVMGQVAERQRLTEEWLFEDPWRAVSAALEGAFEEGNLDSLRSGTMLELKRKPRNSYPTPSGRIEFYSSQAVANGWNPLPTQAPLRDRKDGFVMLTSATPKYTSTQFQEVYGAIPPVVVVNSQDAGQLDIEDGDIVSLSNDLGEVKVRAIVSNAVRVGTVWSPRQSEGLAGQPQNCLMSSEPQEVGGGPRFNSTIVKISRLLNKGLHEQDGTTGESGSRVRGRRPIVIGGLVRRG